LSPSADIYGPLWRIWGILLGTLVVTIVFFVLWPEYAGDSLLPRLRKVIRDTLALAPGGSASSNESSLEAANSETMRVLAEILEVADDARLEGRASMVDHDSVVQAAGTLRRIANRLAAISLGRITAPPPRLDDRTELAREAVLSAIRARLESWLDFYQDAANLRGSASLTLAATHSRNEMLQPLEEFSNRLEAEGFAPISPWTLEQRRTILSELQSLRRLEFLIFELDRYLSSIAQPPVPAAATSLLIPGT
jgi:hypothetical protein